MKREVHLDALGHSIAVTDLAARAEVIVDRVFDWRPTCAEALGWACEFAITERHPSA